MKKINTPAPLSVYQVVQDTRFRKIFWQFSFALIVIFLTCTAYGNVIDSLTTRGMLPSFRFLKLSAGIDIGEQLIDFNNASTNARALLVGFLNTISISFLAIIFSTVIGLMVALCRLSTNWLINRIAWIYIEIIRNIPLLMLLLIWYRSFFLKMPGIKQAVILGATTSAEGTIQANFILSNRGLAILWPSPTDSYAVYSWVLTAGLLVFLAGLIYFAIRTRRTGKKQMGITWSLLAFITIAIVGWLCLGSAPFTLDRPTIGRFNTSGGMAISSEWFSLFSGLVLYTSAFIAEAFRAGIQGVPKGQVEAARALGFGPWKITRLVVIPQAKVVVIPPLTSIYLGVAKNTSLGVAIGFPDLFSISGTIINQTGRSLEMILVVMAIYLALSTITSIFMNWYNRHVQLIER